MDVVYEIIGWVSIPVTLAAVIYSVATWRREHQLTARSLWIPVLVSGVSLWLYTVLIDQDPNPALIWLPFAAGLALGIYVGRTDRVDLRGDAVVAARSPWSFVVWAAAFTATQLVALLAPGSAEAMLGVLFAATGLTIGEQLALISARSTQLGKLRAVAAGAGVVLAVVVLGASMTPRTGFAADVTADLGDVAGMRMQDGTEVSPSIQGVTVAVTGTGTTYSGPSIDVSITNTTADTMRIRVPVGTRLIPADESVQTMLAAGDEVIVVPPGETVTETIQAYCGEANDSAPSSSDTFTVGEPVTGPLLETLQEAADRRDEIADPESPTTTGLVQSMVWVHTDPETHPPPAEGEPGYDLYKPTPPGPTTEETGQAGASTAAVAGAGAVLGTRPTRGGRSGDGGAEGGDGGAEGGDGGDGGDGGESTEEGDGGRPGDTTTPSTQVPIGPVTYDLDTGSTSVQTGGGTISYDRPEQRVSYQDSNVSASYDLDDNTGSLETTDGRVKVQTAPGTATINVVGDQRTTTINMSRDGDTKKVDYLQTGGRYDQRYVLTLDSEGGTLTHTSGDQRDTLSLTSTGTSFTHTQPGMSYGLGAGPGGPSLDYRTDIPRRNVTWTPGVSFANGEWHPSLGLTAHIPIGRTGLSLEPSITAIGGPGSDVQRGLQVTTRF